MEKKSYLVTNHVWQLAMQERGEGGVRDGGEAVGEMK